MPQPPLALSSRLRWRSRRRRRTCRPTTSSPRTVLAQTYGHPPNSTGSACPLFSRFSRPRCILSQRVAVTVRCLLCAQRAQASLASAAELNPFVKVEAVVGDIATKDMEFYKQYRLVVVSNRSYAEQMQINDRCRSAGTMFVSCDVYGLCGYVFADLLDRFSYAECVFPAAPGIRTAKTVASH